MFTSALAAVSGKPNALNFSARDKYVVILVDGLGSHNLESTKGHARFLAAQNSRKIGCWFPSTTAASLMSLSLGLRPGEHPFIGYQVFDRRAGKTLNLLSGISVEQGNSLTSGLETADIFAAQNETRFSFIGPSAYEKSGFTSAFLPSASYLAAQSVSDRFQAASKQLAMPGKEVIYLYVPELDQLAHAKGWLDLSWAMQLEELDALVRSFVEKLNPRHAVVLTADHGVIDVETTQHIYFDEAFDAKEFKSIAGDTRALYLYLADGQSASEMQERLKNFVGRRAEVASPAELRAANYWPEFSAEATNFEPDLVVLATSKVALYHRGFAKPQSLKMVAHHGAVSAEELNVPLFVFGG